MSSYAEQGVTKRDLALYYQAVAGWILPHVVGRPLSLVRCPRGEGGHCFFQKHFDGKLPSGLRGASIREKTGHGTYAVIENLRGLVALVQIGVLELHPWGSTIERIEKPDRIIFDLDPDPKLPWPQIIDAAIELRKFLEQLGLASFVKTTGGKGLHVVLPIAPQLDWDGTRTVTQAIAERFAGTAPRRYTVELAKGKRRGRIFIDYLRNSRGQTAIAPYSPRARAAAPVATPVTWAELEAGLDPSRFTTATVPQRLASLTDDPWAGLAKLRQPWSPALYRDLGL